MKKMAKALVVAILGWQVRRLYKKHTFKTVAVVGSIGKTSTKLAIAQVLSSSIRVRYQDGNYNDIVSVPLIYFGSTLPSLLNPVAWIKIFLNNQRQIKSDYSFDVVVLELGTDSPGQIAAFKRYVKTDIAVVTALTAEHMENFKDLDEVIAEELSVTQFSKQLVANSDLCPAKYFKDIKGYKTYGTNTSDYHITDIIYGENGGLTVKKLGAEWLKASQDIFSKSQLYSLTAAATVADLLGVESEKIVTGFKQVAAVPGRMQRLRGIRNSLIIDDSYNSSPDAVSAALEMLHRTGASQKFALLGNMNELGKYSESSHREIGKLCDPSRLVAVLTLGPEANTFLAEEAEKRGCKVVRFDTPYAAGDWLKEHMTEGCAVLVKGSQNKVYAEEAIKYVLEDPSDQAKLVRQSTEWLKVKESQFGKRPD